MKMHWTEAEELASAMLGMDDEADSDAIEQALSDKFEISFDSFHKLAEALLPFTIPATAALSGEMFHGFVKDGAFIVKAPVRPNAPHEGPSGASREGPLDAVVGRQTEG